MRSSTFVPVLLIVLSLAATAAAQGPNGRPFGLGLSFGDPAGITGKVWFDRKHTLDFAVGYGYFPHYGGAALYADYLYNVLNLVPAQKPGSFDLLLYMGVGGKLGLWRYRYDRAYTTGFGLAVRVPFGLTMVFARHPFDVFLEITPCMAFIEPRPFWFDFDAAIGGRFYF